MVQIPKLEPGSLLLQTLYSGISKGTESLVFAGQVPESEWGRMKCPNMQGSFAFPVTYGYACVCKVIDKGHSVTQFKVGDDVFLLHPHQDIISIPQSSCNLLPQGLPAKRAVLSANMETAVNAVWDAEITGNPKCAVVGAGVVGILTAYAAARLAGVEPVLIDINPDKKSIADALGIRFVEAGGLKESNAGNFDLVFHASASGAGLQTAVDLAGFEAKVIELSWYGDKPVTLNLGTGFHVNRIRLISSQVGSVAPAKRGQVDFAERLQTAMELLDNNNLDILLEPAVGFHDLPELVHDIFSPKGNALCQVIEYTS